MVIWTRWKFKYRWTAPTHIYKEHPWSHSPLSAHIFQRCSIRKNLVNIPAPPHRVLAKCWEHYWEREIRRLSDRTHGNKEGQWGKKGKMILKKFQYGETLKEFSVLIWDIFIICIAEFHCLLLWHYTDLIAFTTELKIDT